MDFKIWIKDDFIPCHRLVIAVYSPYMKAMLMSDMVEATKHEVRFDHISLDIMNIILEYMYSDTINFHSNQLKDLIAASDYLQMTELKQMCVDKVLAILEPENVITWWKEAKKMDFKNIKSRCEEMMTADFEQVSQEPDFLKLEFAAIQDYLNNICGDNVKSNHILDAAMRWVGGEEGRVAHLETLMKHIHLDKCSAEGIRNVMKVHEEILDKQLVMYKYMASSMAMIPLPTLVILGGEVDNTVNNECWKVTKSGIQKLFEIPIGITYHTSVCKIPEGFAYTGGEDSKTCKVFISAKRSWFRLQDMKEARHSHGTTYMNGLLLVIGGCLGQKSSIKQRCTSVHSMVLEGGDWRNEPDLPLAVECPKVSDIVDDVYLLDALNTNQLYKREKGEHVWNKKASLPVDAPSYCAGMTSAQGKLFVAGGRLQICAWYNPEIDTWCLGEKPLGVHMHGALAYHNERLLLLGGGWKEGTDDVEEYDIERGTWSMCSYKMPAKLYDHYALVLDMPPHC